MRKLCSIFLMLTLAVSLLCVTAWGVVNVAQVDGKEYATLQEAVDAADSDATVTLLCDCSGGGVIKPENKSMTIDFGGHTYTVSEAPHAGSAGTETQCFQLLEGGAITMENGTIVADDDGLGVLVQNYCDLTLEKMVLDGSKLRGTSWYYTLSNNCGTTTLKSGTQILAKSEADGDKPIFAMDACKFRDYAIPTVTVESGVAIVGEIEVTGGILHLNGGTFSSNPINYVGEGCAVTKNTDNTYTVKTADTAAAIEVETTGTTTKVTAVDPKGSAETTTIDVSSTGAKEVILEAGALGAVAEEGDPLEVKMGDNTAIKFDGETTKAITSATDAVTLSVDKTVDTTAKTISVAITAMSGQTKLLTDSAASGTMTITIDVSGVFANGTSVTIRHTKESGTVYTYTAVVKDGKVTFANPNGLSTFALSATYVPSNHTTTTTPAAINSPKTADAGVALYAVSALLGLSGMAWVGKKKR